MPRRRRARRPSEKATAKCASGIARRRFYHPIRELPEPFLSIRRGGGECCLAPRDATAIIGTTRMDERLMQAPTRPFIDGEFRDTPGSRPERIAMINPATEETWCEVAAADGAAVERAVTGAQRAFEQDWRDMTPGKRAEVLFAVARLIRQNLEELAQLDVRSVGKPIADARDEVALGARVFEYYAGAVGKFFGHTIPVARGGGEFTLRPPP